MKAADRLDPRPYQDEDIARASEMERCLLLHDLGLGKTLISTRVAEGHWPVVVLVRSHLVIQWIKHIRREYPTARIASVVIESPRASLGWRAATPAEKDEIFAARPGYDFYVLTYSTIRRVRKTKDTAKAAGLRSLRETWNDTAEEQGWIWGTKAAKARFKKQMHEYRLPPCKTLILDESHICRGRNSQQFKGAYQLAVSTKSRKAAERVLLLTHTPIWREPDDLYAQLRLLDPARFRSYFRFVDHYCLTEETDYGTKVIGGRKKRIAKLLAEYGISRHYADPDVRIAVPKILTEEIWSYLAPTSSREYERLTRKLDGDRKEGFGVGSGISDYSRITAHDPNKLSDLEEAIEGLEGDFALFGWYHDTVELLAKHFGLPLFMGSSQKSGSGARSGGGDRYTRGEAIKKAGTFVATIGCIQEGIDLSHLRNMIFYECDYTHGAMEQLRGRLARWRQDNSTDPINAIYVLAAGTVDEYAYEASMGRGATAEDIMRRITAAHAERKMNAAEPRRSQPK